MAFVEGEGVSAFCAKVKFMRYTPQNPKQNICFSQKRKKRKKKEEEDDASSGEESGRRSGEKENDDDSDDVSFFFHRRDEFFFVPLAKRAFCRDERDFGDFRCATSERRVLEKGRCNDFRKGVSSVFFFVCAKLVFENDARDDARDNSEGRKTGERKSAGVVDAESFELRREEQRERGSREKSR